MADPDYFTLDEFKALIPDVDDFEDAEIEAAAAHFTEIVEREIGSPMIERAFTATFDGSARSPVVLSQRNIRTVTAVTVDGTAVDVDDLTFVGGVLRYLSGEPWVSGVANVVVTYTAGKYETCPADIKSTVMWATRDRLISQHAENVNDPRQQSMTNDLGGSTVFVLPGEKRPSGYPDLDAVIASYKRATAPLVG